MRLLGIETSGTIGGFAVLEDGHLVAEIIADITGRHVEKSVTMIKDVLERTAGGLEDLGGVAVSLGPGSFTGLRVGLSIAKGICFGKGIPLAGVPTLDCVAETLSYWEGLVIPAKDARRDEIYFSVYRATEGSLTRLTGYQALTLERFIQEIERIDDGHDILLAGDALPRYGEVVKSKLGSRVILAPEIMWMARPAIVARIGLRLLGEGQAADLDSIEPMYIRPSEAERATMRLVTDGNSEHKKNERSRHR